MSRPRFATRASILVTAVALVLASSCAEESAEDRPDQSAETKKRAGAVLEELPDVVPVPADAEPSPLVDGLESLMTFDEAFAVVKEYPHHIEFEHVLEARGVCPGLQTRMLEVVGWMDLGMKGKLTLTFYNGILGGARFEVGDLEGYKRKAKEVRGVPIRSVKRNYLEPATEVWIPVLPPYAPVYSDVRVNRWQESLGKACLYQMQIDDGISPAPETSTD